MTNEEDRAADTIERALNRRQVLLEGVQAILNGNYLVPVGLQGRNAFAETRAIGPNTVAEDDRWLSLSRHAAFSFFLHELQRWRQWKTYAGLRLPGSPLRCGV